jgi:hypothetical protein
MTLVFVQRENNCSTDLLQSQLLLSSLAPPSTSSTSPVLFPIRPTVRRATADLLHLGPSSPPPPPPRHPNQCPHTRASWLRLPSSLMAPILLHVMLDIRSSSILEKPPWRGHGRHGLSPLKLWVVHRSVVAGVRSNSMSHQ